MDSSKKLKRILIVDDSDFDRTLLASALEKKTNVEIVQAKDGQECLNCLLTENIDLVLLDILMPQLNGEEVLKKIRDKFNHIELPVIMVTSKSETSDIIRFLQHGANDYITKPVTFDVAISRITTQLGISDLSREMAKLKELMALNAMISTYNHEINNPLTIAIHCAEYRDLSDEGVRQKLIESLWRISDTVKKIRLITENEIKFEDYATNFKMLSIKK